MSLLLEMEFKLGLIPFLVSTRTYGTLHFKKSRSNPDIVGGFLKLFLRRLGWLLFEYWTAQPIFFLGSVFERLLVLVSTTHEVFLFLSTLCCTFITFLFATELYTHQCMIRCQSWSVISDLFCSLFETFSLNFVGEFDIQGLFLC